MVINQKLHLKIFCQSNFFGQRIFKMQILRIHAFLIDLID